MLATPVIGFVVGAGGYLAAQVFADTYTGKMPGPKSFGYFIGTITAATVLGLAFMGRKQGYLAESSYIKSLTDDQVKPPKQDFSKLDLTGYYWKGRPIKRAEEYVAELSIPEQKIIEHRLRKALENDYSGADLEDHIERGLGSRVSDLSDTIDISDFAAESINNNDITEMIEKLSGLGYQWCELCGFHYDDENHHRQEQCSYPEYVVSPASDVDSMRDTLVEL